jgi:hypothetical protein
LGNSGDEVIATGFDDSTIDKTVNGTCFKFAHITANGNGRWFCIKYCYTLLNPKFSISTCY